MNKKNINEREIVFLILNDYFKNNSNLKNLVNKYMALSSGEQRDKDFIFNIAKGTVREKIKIDFFIKYFSKLKFEKIDADVLNLLRPAVFQLLYADRIPAYSILNESVEIAKKNISFKSSGFVNAVLRKIASLDDTSKFFEEKLEKINDISEKMSLKYSFPKWIVDYWIKYFSWKKTEKILKSLNQKPQSFFFINKIKISPEDFREYLNENNPDCEIEFLFDNESFKQNEKISGFLKNDLFQKGYIYLQDLSSQIAVRYFLKPSENDCILDACAAPGGKMINSSSLMNNKGVVFGLEYDSLRHKTLKDNIERYGIKNAVILEADASEDFEYIIKEKNMHPKSGKKIFDKILLDMPCSAFGTISKNPDVKYNKNFEDLKKLKEKSLKIMLNCSEYLKDGGIMVFYTCTISPVENNDLVNEFLSIKKDSFKLLKVPSELIFNNLKKIYPETEIPEKNFYLEIMPYYFGSEGAFICSLQKNEEK